MAAAATEFAVEVVAMARNLKRENDTGAFRLGS
jgi:hypothetical protein